MNLQVNNSIENNSRIIANSSVKKKSNVWQRSSILDNRPKSFVQGFNKLKPKGKKTNLFVIQNKDNITKRNKTIRDLNSEIQTLKDDNQDINSQASKDEIGRHDKLMSSGQHHSNRTVTIKDLASDLQKRVDDLSGFNTRDQSSLDDELKKEEKKQDKDKILQL